MHDGVYRNKSNPRKRPLCPDARYDDARITDENKWLDGIALGRHETITWRTRSGFTANGVLVYPPNYHAGKRLPLALVIHGGPTSSSNNSFSAFADTLAAHGWFVFEPNYVGSDNEGVKYASAIVPHVSSMMGNSIEDGLAALLKRGIIDPNKIAVPGWSCRRGLRNIVAHYAMTRAGRAAATAPPSTTTRKSEAMTDSKDYPRSIDGSATLGRRQTPRDLQIGITARVRRSREVADAHPERRGRLPRTNAAFV